jgi:1,2-dihydroxy-3-keto-5-methylthiopentene dioxygenase
MATLRIPDKDVTLRDPIAVRQFLNLRGIVNEKWSPDRDLASSATNEQILAAYDYLLKPLMEKYGHRTTDVIAVDGQTPNLEGIREKFLREHTHSEDEVRVFVEGQGIFWFHTERGGDEVFALLCEQNDLISVPANTKHWFDLGDPPKVRALRIFTDQAGWVPRYTNSGIDQCYRW